MLMESSSFIHWLLTKAKESLLDRQFWLSFPQQSC